MGPDDGAFLEALDLLEEVLTANVERAHLMQGRIAEIRDALGDGRSLKEIVPEETPPPLVRLLSDSSHALSVAGKRVRQTEAQALHRAGLTMDDIAALFGVTRQRVSAVLRDANAADRER